MRILLRCLIGAALCAGVAVLLRAQDFEPEHAKGTVLLLKNGHTMVGDVEKLGGRTRVRSGGSEVWITNDRVARLCTDWDDAYRFLQTQIKAESADDHVKVARWCHSHRLHDKALEQAQKALALKPAHNEARRLAALLERAGQDPSEERPPAKPQPIKTPEPAPLTVDVASETLIGFTTRVQPILMNACASCHATGHGGTFVLERVSENASKAGTQRNLAAVLDLIDLDHPNISPLLERSIKAHGGEQRSAFHGRDAAAFKKMQLWILQTVEKNPQLHDYRAVNRKPASLVKTETPTKTEVPVKTKSTKAEPAITLKTETPTPIEPAIKLYAQSVTTSESPKKTPAAVAPATPMPQRVVESDPFDPTPFNQHFHAQRSERTTNTAK